MKQGRQMMEFKDPWILLIAPVVLVLIYFVCQYKRKPTFRFSSGISLQGVLKSFKVKISQNFFVLRLLSILFFLIALAGPRQILEEVQHKTEGIDIVLAIDVSGSMAAEDFKLQNKRVNRLDIVKSVVEEFIDGRKNDRIGIVAFSRFAYTLCPLTLDHDWLLTNLERLKLGLIEDGTAIGSAVASSVARLKNSKAKSKIIILLTDGVNNAGKIDPIEAAKIAEANKIRIYTIGVGTKGLVPFPVKDFWGRTGYQNVEINLDDQTLKEIAKVTSGEYFWAMDTESLRNIYKAIDQLEKTEIEQSGYRDYQQLFWIFLGLGLFVLCVEIILSRTLFLRIP
ncbi:MAG: VWA domain-containing protein [Candidatus Omnitrophica bacterium]|nr:VWA domain-containing protein [Candidatus Omnitrophota bacterium]